MKFYLSSYGIGQESEKLKQLAQGKKIWFIPNAMDAVEPEARAASNEKHIQGLVELGIEVEMLDLREYFGKSELLAKKLATLWGVWVRGGNTFILRQAMHLSGFDFLIQRMERENFLYAGFSAGVCVLAPSLEALQQVDQPELMPYPELQETLWEGLGILDYIVLPHYQSDHPESAAIDLEVEFCKANYIPYQTLKDGEVIIIE